MVTLSILNNNNQYDSVEELVKIKEEEEKKILETAGVNFNDNLNKNTDDEPQPMLWRGLKNIVYHTWYDVFLKNNMNPEEKIEAIIDIIHDVMKIKNISFDEPATRLDLSLLNALIFDFEKNNESISDEKAHDLLEVASSQLYHNFRGKISKGDFDNGKTWPEADLSSKEVQATSYIVPDKKETTRLTDEDLRSLQEEMWEKVKELQKQGDLAADIFDTVIAKWLKEAKSYNDIIAISIDDFLEMRGLKKKTSGHGRRGGYTEKQRAEIAKHIEILERTWIEVNEMKVYTKDSKKPKREVTRGRPLIIEGDRAQKDITGEARPFMWILKPGIMFAKYLFSPYGRQTALLSQKALEYDPYREFREKRLARYFAWIWRISSQKTMEGISVEPLLEVTGDIDNLKRPGRVKEKLEKAFNKLEEDGVITSWEYESLNESGVGKKNWAKKWLETKIIVEPPQKIFEQYDHLQKIKDVQETSEKSKKSLQNDLKTTRKKLGLTISRTAEQIGVSASTLSRIERGGNIGKETANKIKKWLKKHES